MITRATALDISNVANPDLFKVNNDFNSFQITPYEHDNDPNFKKAIYVEEAEGRAVCMSVPKFREARDGYKKAKICESMPTVRRGYGIIDLVIVGIISASLTYSTMKLFQWSGRL